MGVDLRRERGVLALYRVLHKPVHTFLAVGDFAGLAHMAPHRGVRGERSTAVLALVFFPARGQLEYWIARPLPSAVLGEAARVLE